MNLVFSYGTLTDKFNKEAKEATLRANLRLGEYSYYPALIDSNKENIIEGKVIELTDKELRHADHYEGHPSLYKRRKYDVELENGDIEIAWVYILNEEKETK